MKKNQSSPQKRHHVRPKWYLQGFSVPSDRNCCHSLKVDSGDPICNTNVEKLAVVKGFYSIFDDVAGMEPETAIFDGIVSKVFSNIVSEDSLTGNTDDFQVLLEFISRMITFDDTSRITTIRGIELIQEPGVVEERRQIQGDPLPLLLMGSSLPMYRKTVNNLDYRLLLAGHNSFLCPDALYFTATRSEEIILFFPINENLCLYGNSSEDVLRDFFPTTSLVNTLLLLHSYRFAYFSDWDLEIHNGISGVPIKNFKNRGIDGMFKNFILRIQDTIDLILPDKEPLLYLSIISKFIDMNIATDTFKDLMCEIDPSLLQDPQIQT